VSIDQELSQGWVWTKLGDIGHWFGGGTPSKTEVQFWISGDIPWVSPKDMKALQIIDTEDHLSKAALEERNLKLCPVGTILVVVRSGILQRTLPIAVSQVPVTMNQDMKGIYPADNINSMYIAYYLISSTQDVLLRCSKDGTTVNSIETEALKIYPVPLAPANEQHRIVAAIEQQFSRLDAAVTSLQHARAKLKRQRAAILKAAVEGTLTADWRAQHPAVETAEQLLQRILHERRAKWEAEQLAKMQTRGVTPKDDKWKGDYKEPEPPDTTNLPGLPKGGCWVKFGQVAFFQNGRGFPSSEYKPEGFKLLRPGNLFADGTVKWNQANTRCLSQIWAERNPDLIVRGHELIMNLTAQSLKDEFLGRVCITSRDEECLLNQRLARITPLKGLSSSFVLYMLKSFIFRHFVDGLNKGSLIQHMFTSQLENFSFPLPPLAEQQQIVSEVEARLSIIAQTEFEVEANLKRAERLRQTILAQAFAGRLVPQDPDDEPASVLLARIRQERSERDGMQKKGKSGNGRARTTVKVPDEPVKIDVDGMEQVALWESVGG
jgi:type I restriction enzyme S subunit